jgi:hypothetical protein
VRIALYVIAGWTALTALVFVANYSKPREPVGGVTAAFILALDAAIITTLMLAASRLAWLEVVLPAES